MLAQLALGLSAYLGVRRKLRNRVDFGLSGDLAQLAARLLPLFPGVQAVVAGGLRQMPAGFAPGKVFLSRQELQRVDLTATYVLCLSLVNAGLMPKSIWNILKYLGTAFYIEILLLILAAIFGGIFSLLFCATALAMFAGSNYFYYELRSLGEQAAGLLVEQLNLPEQYWPELQSIVQTFYWQIFSYPISAIQRIIHFFIP
jgi:hypothetical protein